MGGKNKNKYFIKIIFYNVISCIVLLKFRPDFYWWTGQCQRTFNIGIFPRCWTEPSGRRRNGEDISQPLIHSFIHTGIKYTSS